ncbi:nitroreductase/quinone reductase family protein [Amycolatopsis carbonis]|uniref:Nitroreductase/quinone reductase family protein n=1 Tax=Amycolatopsis carbonis TaxID=715471 RepID=A0A9Y2ICP0_9PSEU|nr:nitroreductase/quinone reductase family protein [Amycolatopsis sp. 2-15]WIX76831.1 nitroreductase/quinone reductase family protein [Amycolatopsis sp. 2-15]
MRRVKTDQASGRWDGPGAAARRRRFDRLQRSVINPLDKLAFALRIPPPGDALLETIGRRTAQPRITPVCDGTDGDTFWIIAQHGRSADYIRNIEANPRVRVKGSLSRTGWRSGTAHILDDDDPSERMRILSRGNRWRRLCLQASGAAATSPLSVRIELDPRP